MTEPLNIRVLLVEDHVVVRRGIALILNSEEGMEVVAEAQDGRTALELFRRYRPDVTLMDLRLPGMSGVDAIKAIRAEFPRARIMVLTTFDGDEEIYKALKAGALAYLLKDTTCEELVRTIRKVSNGQKHITAEVGVKLAEHAGREQLTEREMEVLGELVQGKSNQEVASSLSICEGTVKFHVNHILSKMGVTDRTQAVVCALRRGLSTLN